MLLILQGWKALSTLVLGRVNQSFSFHGQQYRTEAGVGGTRVIPVLAATDQMGPPPARGRVEGGIFLGPQPAAVRPSTAVRSSSMGAVVPGRADALETAQLQALGVHVPNEEEDDSWVGPPPPRPGPTLSWSVGALRPETGAARTTLVGSGAAVAAPPPPSATTP